MECMKLTYHDGLLRVIAAVEDDTEQVVLYCEDKKEKTSLKHSSLKTQYVLEPCMSISLHGSCALDKVALAHTIISYNHIIIIMSHG